MEIEAKIVEKKTGKIRNWVRKHKGLLVTGGLAVLGTMAVVILTRQKPEEAIMLTENKTTTTYETDSEFQPDKGYDIWAMCNGKDQKVVEFAPKLEEFAKENDIKMMCEVF
jgi:hypothetical protein